MTTIARIARISLTSADPDRLARFYVAALGFVSIGTMHFDAAPYGVAGNARIHRLRLGRQEIELVGFEQPGAPYPVDSTSHDGWFQHMALVSADIAASHARLSAVPGWRTITSDGQPVLLPASSGGVTAFKFRDPEGHPLELLAFPAGQAPALWTHAQAAGPLLGIDHSAIVVTDSDRSIAFYEALGLQVGARSLNQGPAQEALDAAPAVQVAVTALSPPDPAPHLELLAYRTPPVRSGAVEPADIACTRMLLVTHDGAEAGRRFGDPDGHTVMLVDS